MSIPLDHFEPDTPPPPANRRFLGLLYWAGLSLMNGLLGNVWLEKWDSVLFALGTTGLYLIVAWQFAYSAHLLIEHLLLAGSQALIRCIPSYRLFCWSDGIKGLFSTVKLGLLSQLVVLGYLLSQILR